MSDKCVIINSYNYMQLLILLLIHSNFIYIYLRTHYLLFMYALLSCYYNVCICSYALLYKFRLATEMNSKISANESNLENISVGIRPMTVADDYTNFCSDSWLEACSALEEEGEEEDMDGRYQLLCHILMVGFITRMRHSVCFQSLNSFFH